MAEKIGIIHSIEDENREYTPAGGKLTYVFAIVVGTDKGQCGSQTKPPKYKKGDKVKYTIKETKKEGMYWISISGLADAPPGANNYNNPEDVAGLIHTEALKRSQELCLLISKMNQSKMNLDIDVFIKSAKSFAEFLGKEQKDKLDKNLVYQKNRILEVAIELYDNDIAAAPNKKDHKANVLIFAEAMWNDILQAREDAKPKEKSE